MTATDATGPSAADGALGGTDRTERPAFDEPGSRSREARWLVAGASLLAAGIHFGFAPEHLAEDWRHGTFFLVLAWFQLLFAVIVVTRPGRLVLAAGVAVSAGTLAVWAVSRTVGLPTAFGGDGSAEPSIVADQLSSLLEAIVLVGSALLLARPGWLRRPAHAPQAAATFGVGLLALGLVAASMSLTPEYTAGHHHGEAGGHSHGAAGHTHGAAGPYNGDSPCEKATKNRPPEGADPAAKNSGHDHHGALPQKPIDDATRTELAAQQELARAVTAKYPTVADATADGYRLSTVYIPCIGAHYTKTSLVVGFNPSTPSELLYDGTSPDSKMIGLSYLLFHPGGPPAGFAGPNDVWHQHSSNGGLCQNPAGVVIGGEKMSKATCEKRGGHKSGLKDIWMVHDWVAPGWECSWGVFAAECPELGGRIGGTSSDPIS